MKRLLGIAVSTVLLGAPLGAAFAADMPVKGPAPVAPVVATDWTGLYFDVAAGWERTGYSWYQYNAPGFGLPTSTITPSGSGTVIGGHIGYQQQFGWIVAGLEVGALRNLGGQATVVYPGPTGGVVGCGNITGNICKFNLSDISLAGGKLGVAWQDWLVYAVGGSAFGATVNSSYAPTGGGAFETPGLTGSQGWYLGAGVDLMLIKTRFGDLIAGVEYEHVNLKTNITTSSFQGFSPAGIDARNTSAKEDLVWAKLTLKLSPWN